MILRLLVLLIISALLCWAAADNGQRLYGVPIIFICGLWIFLLQWLCFIPAYIRQTEKYYDLVGSLTYISTTVFAALAITTTGPRSLLLATCVLVWALRLGSFLFRRISQDGADSRFDKIKPVASRFFLTWNLQALWVIFTLSCALAAITSGNQAPLTMLDLVALLVFLCGFTIEVIADRQKRVFRQQMGSETFISSGLWARSRHPNYFGEILLWLGIALLALPALQGWQLVTLVSPVFVYLLLTRISGIPLLERKADARWGADPAYQAYKQNTPVLRPRLILPVGEKEDLK